MSMSTMSKIRKRRKKIRKRNLFEGDDCPDCNGTGHAATPNGIKLLDGPFPCATCYGRGILSNAGFVELVFKQRTNVYVVDEKGRIAH